MAQYDALLQPLSLKHLTLKNRVMSTSHAPGYVQDGHPKLRYQLYHEEKAKGGLALTMFGGSSNVAPDSPSAFGQIDIGDDSIIPVLQAFSQRIHAYDTALMCQITHMGRRTVWNVGHWLPTVAPSLVREPAHRSFPKEMETADIKRIVKHYGAAARRCYEGGLDGCELIAYGHLIDQFWTPSINQRTDEYGGRLENRMRFSREVLEEMRAQVGDEFILGLRMPGAHDFEGGLTRDECLTIAQYHAATGLIDFLNIYAGTVATETALSKSIPSIGTPMAPFVEVAGRIKRAVDLPVFHATRIADLASAEYAIREGHVDMVAMTRAHMADPHIVAKLERGEPENIRPCVGMGYCLDRIYEGGDALCAHNPATGREATMPHVIQKSSGPRRKIVVVGAGPAGLEAARVSAERGHEVVLFEASGQAGGQIPMAAQVKRRREIVGISDWLYAQVQRLGVQTKFNCYAGVSDVAAETPDVVVVATGGVPNTTFIAEGAEHVTSSWDVLSGNASPGSDVLLFDDNGQHPGLACAEFLVDKCARLELVTPDRMVAHDVGGLNFPVYMKVFYEHGVIMTPDHRLVSVRKDGNKLVAVFTNEFNEAVIERRVDQVIVEHATRPADELYFSLKEGSTNLGETDIDALIRSKPQRIVTNPDGAYQLFRVGDAVSSRNIHAAIYDSLRLCKEF